MFGDALFLDHEGGWFHLGSGRLHFHWYNATGPLASFHWRPWRTTFGVNGWCVGWLNMLFLKGDGGSVG